MIWFIVVLTTITLVLLAAPRLNIPSLWQPKPLEVDLTKLADWLEQQEQQQPYPITPNAEKHLSFVNPNQAAKTPLCVLYLHGFSACRQEINPVSERVAQALGANHYATRLNGHGSTPEALGEATASQWLKDVEEAWEIACLLGEQVIVIACSTGATLATWLAEQKEVQPHLAALILIAPNYQPKQWTSHLLTWPWSNRWIPLFMGKYYGFASEKDLSKTYWTHNYPIKVLHQLQALVVMVRNSQVERIQTPTLFIYSRFDQVVHPGYIQKIYQRWGSDCKEQIVLEAVNESNHVIMGDIINPERTETSVEQMLEFLRRVLS